MINSQVPYSNLDIKIIFKYLIYKQKVDYFIFLYKNDKYDIIYQT